MRLSCCSSDIASGSAPSSLSLLLSEKNCSRARLVWSSTGMFASSLASDAAATRFPRLPIRRNKMSASPTGNSRRSPNSRKASASLGRGGVFVVIGVAVAKIGGANAAHVLVAGGSAWRRQGVGKGNNGGDDLFRIGQHKNARRLRIVRGGVRQAQSTVQKRRRRLLVQ